MPDANTVSAREVARLTIPQLGLMFCHMVMSMTDLWVAGQLDEGVLAALGFISQIYSLLMLLTAIVGSGCMAMVSQSLGAGKSLRARRYSGLIVCLSFSAGSLVALLAVGILAVLPLEQMVPAHLVPVARTFGLAYAAQLPFYYSLIMLNSVFRAHKLVWLPTTTLCFVAGINFIGSAGLGLGWWGLPRLGYEAVAWTTFGASVAGFICNAALAVRTGILRPLSFAAWRWNRLAMPRLWRVGAPAMVGNVAAHAGSLALLACVSSLPHGAVDAVAGMTLGMRVMGFVLFPVAGLGMTITILGGHMIGAGLGRAGYVLGLRYGLRVALALAVAGGLLCLLRQPVTLAFTADSGAVNMAELYLVFSCLVLPLQGMGQMLNSILAGAGATRFTCRISCISTWGISVPVAYVLGHWTRLGAAGIFAGMACGSAAAALWTLRVYMRKKWLGSTKAVW